MASRDRRPFSAGVRREDGATIIDLHGEINGAADDALNAAYVEANALHVDTILLNFDDVDYINSTGIALIVSILALARKAKQELVIFGLSEHYQEIFQITRLADFMTIYADERAALQQEESA